MAHTYEELSKMNVAQLREIAQGIEHEAVKGSSTMHKDKLLHALTLALGLEAQTHHHAVGAHKGEMKAEIRVLKKKKVEALQAKDRKQFKEILRRIHRLKHKLRRMEV